MEDIVELMRNEKEDYGAAYECGVMDGEVRGQKRGKKEGIVKVAKSMVDENIDINIISKVTGLSIKEVSKLKIN